MKVCLQKAATNLCLFTQFSLVSLTCRPWVVVSELHFRGFMAMHMSCDTTVAFSTVASVLHIPPLHLLSYFVY